jgi:SulP family sulfate permease
MSNSTRLRKQFLFRPRFFSLFQQPYRSKDLTSDICAGITVGLIALPLALALGVASIPPGTVTPYPAPALGLFTAIIAGFLISFLGGSRVQIGGPTAAFVPVILLIIEKHGYDGLIVATVIAGLIQIVMGLARMGTLIKFIPWPVTSGFTTGIAVSIIATATPDLFGIHAQTTPPREFLAKIQWLAENVVHGNPGSLLVAILVVAIIYFWPRLGVKQIPGSIVAMIATTLLLYAVAPFDPNRFGIATLASKFGPHAIPQGFPAVHWTIVDWRQIRDLLQPATAIALLGAIESLLSAVVADGLADDRHDSNTELIAQGISNLVCPFFGGLPATGAIARTSANINNGAKSPAAGIIHSLTLLLIVLAAAGLAGNIPICAMSAVLLMVALRMGEWHELTRLRVMPRSDAVVLLATFLLTVVFDLVIAVELGMVLAAILFIKRVSETTEVSQVTGDDVLESPEQLAQGKEIPNGVLVYRIFGPFLFGAAEKMSDALERIDEIPRVLILRLHLVTAMDATALNALESIIERFQHHGSTVVLSGLHRQPLEMLRKAGFIEVIGRQNLCAHFDAALTRARVLLDAPEQPRTAKLPGNG